MSRRPLKGLHSKGHTFLSALSAVLCLPALLISLTTAAATEPAINLHHNPVIAASSDAPVAQPVPIVHPELFLEVGHNRAVTAVAFSPDGKRLATGGADVTAKIWDAKSGIVERTLIHTHYVTSLAFSPDGTQLVTGSGVPWGPGERNTPGEVRLWDVQSGALLYTLTGHSACVTSVAFSPDGKMVASGSVDTRVMIWDAETGVPEHTLTGHTDDVLSVAFSQDSKRIASGGEDHLVLVHNIQTGAIQFTLLHASTVQSVAFSPDGRRIITGCGAWDRVGGGTATGPYDVLLWDAQTGMLQQTLAGHTLPVRSVTFSSDGAMLATAAGVLIKLWDPKTGALKRTIDSHSGNLYGVALSPDGSTAASAGDDHTLRLWSVQTGALERTLAARTAQIRSLALSPDGGRLATASLDRAVRLWNARSGALERTMPGHTSILWSVAFSPDGRTVASSSTTNWDQTQAPGEVRLWSSETGLLERTLTGHAAGVNAVTFSPDGKILATASWDKTVKLWDSATGSLERTLAEHPGCVTSVAFSPDGKIIASGCQDNNVYLWDAQTGQLKSTLTGHARGITTVAFSPDGSKLASASADRTIKLWDAHTGALQSTLTGHEDTLWRVVFSPDGRTLATAGYDATVRLWDVQTGAMKQTMRFTTPAYAAVFTPDGSKVISGCDDGTLSWWDTGTGQLLVTVVPMPPPPGEEISTEGWLAYTPQGYYDGSPGADRFIKWRLGGDIFPVGAFEAVFHRPDLVRKAMAGDTLPATPAVQRFIVGQEIPPQAAFTSPAEGQDVSGDEITVDISCSSVQRVTDVRLLINGRPVAAKAIMLGAKPLTLGAKPLMLGAKAIMLGAKPISLGSKTIPSSHTLLQQYRFNVPLPPGETQVTLRAVASDEEGLQGWDELHLQRKLAAPVTGDLYILSVGVSQYANPRFNLKYAASDASAFAGLWKRMEGSLYQHIISVELTDGQATSEKVRAAVFKLLETVTDRDTVAVFLSGHGIQAGEGNFYFATHEIDPSTAQSVAETGLPWSVFQTTLAKLDARRVFLFLDACHSGNTLGGQQANNERLAETLVKRGGVLVFASSRGSQFSYEVEDRKHGAFTMALIEGIGEGKADLEIAGLRDGKITAEKLLAYLRVRVAQLTQNMQTPTCPLLTDFGEAPVLATAR